MPNEIRRVCVISFDFKQRKGENQSRKTQFFRELYGYTQQVKQQLKDGQIIIRTYNYPGVMDQIPYTKLGKSVIAVQPGDEDAIIKVLRSFDEVEFYKFIGWLSTSIWPTKNGIERNRVNTLIAAYGYLSVLIQLRESGEEKTTYSTLSDAGFDMSYINQAVQFLKNQKLLIEIKNTLEFSSKGKEIAGQLT
jgi:hypothetical protein